MEPFSKVTSKITPFDKANVDTDQIIPKQFLKLITKSGFAPSFADIFFSNCFKNGVLPIILDVTQVEKLLKVQDSVELDLNSQKITFGNESITFEIDSHRKTRLLEGLDDIDLTLKENKNIENFENNSNIIPIF